MDATTVEECWRLLRQTGKSNSYESLANLPRYTAWLQQQDWTDAYARHKAEPPAGRAQRPGEALGAQEPVAHDGARRADDRLPGRADRLHAPRPGHLHRLVVLAVGRDDGRPLRRRTSAASSATPSSTCGRARSTRSTTRGRRTTRTSSSTSPSPTCVSDPLGVTRGIYEQFGLDWTPRGRGGDRARSTRSRSRARRAEARLHAQGLRPHRGPGPRRWHWGRDGRRRPKPVVEEVAQRLSNTVKRRGNMTRSGSWSGAPASSGRW